MKEDIIYAFNYCPCIYESASATISIHKTKKGAEMALEYHKNEAKKEWDEMYKYLDDDPLVPHSEFGNNERWYIEELTLKP